VIGTIDTKGEELRYVRDLIVQAGIAAVLADVGPRSLDLQCDGHGHVKQVERIFRVIGDPRSGAAGFLDQGNLEYTSQGVRKMDCDHRPAKARADDGHVDVTTWPRNDRLFNLHCSSRTRSFELRWKIPARGGRF
jgi:hypothetical protein